MAALQFNDVAFHYEDPYVQVFERLDLAIDTDWRCALVGRNGRGKTTLLRLIQGDIEATKGEVSVPCETSYFPFSAPAPERATRAVLKDCVAPFVLWEARIEQLLAAGDEASLAEYGELLETFEKRGDYLAHAALRRSRSTLHREYRHRDRGAAMTRSRRHARRG
jgi:lincosamide and streptogramin A transport system ATP-binding/permease protein